MAASCNGCKSKTWNAGMMRAPVATTGAAPAPISQQSGRSYSQLSQGGGRVRGGRFTTHAQAQVARRHGMFISTCALVAIALVALYLWKR